MTATDMSWLCFLGFIFMVAIVCILNVIAKQGRIRLNPSLPRRYQPIERNASGRITGWKALIIKGGEKYSPRTHDKWVNGELTADRTPTPRNENGIYIAKRKQDLKPFVKIGCRIVHVEATGQIIEHQTGYRASKARIIGEEK